MAPADVVTRYTINSAGAGAWQKGTLPTPGEPGTSATPAQIDAVKTQDAGRWSTSLVSGEGATNYQMFRFKLNELPPAVSKLTLKWTGYGQLTPGYPVNLSIWNKNTLNWDVLTSQMIGTENTLQLSLPGALPGLEEYVNPQGEVYILAGARHDATTATIASGPLAYDAASGSLKLTWDTNEPTRNNYIEYGTTPVYGSTAVDVNTGYKTTQNVNLSLFPDTVYYYRLRGTDSGGNEYVSTGYSTFLPPALIDRTNIEGYFPMGVPLSWNAAGDATRAPYTYQVQVLNSFTGALVTQSGWLTNTNWTPSITSPGYYSWRIWARDKNMVVSAWSARDNFNLTVPPKVDSCPFIYVWDGKEFKYSSDMSGPVLNLPKHIKLDSFKMTPYHLPLKELKPNAVNDYEIKIRSTAQGEVEFIDQSRLAVLDHPPGYEIISASAEYSGFIDYKPKQQFYAIAEQATTPIKATDKYGKDISEQLAALDSKGAPVDRENPAGPDYYTLDFGKIQDPEYAKLVLDGWTHYNNSNKAKQVITPQVQVINSQGQWEKVRDIGFISGDKKSMVIDLANAFKTNDHRIRIYTGIPVAKMIIDRARLDQSPPIDLKITYLDPYYADLHYRGPATQVNTTFEHPVLAKDDVKPGEVEYVFYGKFTKFGDVKELLKDNDDRFVIMQHGDEISLKFRNPAPVAGKVRSTVLLADFYYKQTGLPKFNPKVKLPVEPLPFLGMSAYPYPAGEKYPTDAKYKEYQENWNTREYMLVEGKVYKVEGLLHSFWLHVRQLWSEVKTFSSKLWPSESNKTSAAEPNKPLVAETTTIKAADPIIVPIAPANQHYSLNTNYIELSVVSNGGNSNGSCNICHNAHGKDDGTGGQIPYPKQLNQQLPNSCYGETGLSCHAISTNSVNGINIKEKMTVGANSSFRHDVTCNYCHDPHLNNSTQKVIDPDKRFTAIDIPNDILKYIGPDGKVFTMVKAKHDGTPPVISNVTITNITSNGATISWTTNENTNTLIDYGTSTAYGSVAGSVNMISTDYTKPSYSHSITLTGLQAGIDYHVRVRAADAVGNQSQAEGYTFRPSTPPTAPTLVRQNDITTANTSSTVTLNIYQPSIDPDGDPVEYKFEILGGPSTVWSSAYSGTLTLNHMYGTTAWQWRAIARDPYGAMTPSVWETFRVFGPPEPKWDSCPFIFVWNGKEYEYTSDMSGPVLNLPGHIQLDSSKMNPYYLPLKPLAPDKHNKYQVKIRSLALGEVDIIDEAKLAVIDHAPGYEIVSASGEYTGMIDYKAGQKFYAVSNKAKTPEKATDKYGQDITQLVTSLDTKVAPVDRDNPAGPDYYTLDFGKIKHPEYAKLVFDGWTYYINGNKAKAVITPQVQVKNAAGKWEKVRDIGFISGDKKSMVVDLANAFKSNDHRIRVYTGVPVAKMVIDRVRLDQSPPIELKVQYLDAESADLYYRGPSNQKGTFYDHPVIAKDDVKKGEVDYIFYGKFTKYGDVLELLGSTDDRFVIMQHGDEIMLKFKNPKLTPGLQRSTVLMADFYYKQTGSAKRDPAVKVPVEPLPFRSMSSYPYPPGEKYPDDAEHRKYLKEWNTREYRLVDGKVIKHEGFWQTLLKRGNELTQWFRQQMRELFAKQEKVPPNLKEYFKKHPPKVVKEERAGKPEHYSLNTNMMSVRVTHVYGASIYLPNNVGSAIWESLTEPVISSLGEPVANTVYLDSASAMDSNNWRTALATAEGDYNYQVFQMTVSEQVYKISNLGILWNGYGEPTPNHETSLYVWNYQTGNWELLQSKQIYVPESFYNFRQLDNSAFCSKCHDGTPPAGLPTTPSNVRW
ncbi:MAG: fibronectin type III domain-containing protein [Clostridia bacterium]|nr:fibronectin type III domain-containing protein [Clostridia bacterium]